MFTVHNPQNHAIELPDLDVKPVSTMRSVDATRVIPSTFDLIIDVTDTGKQLQVIASYSVDTMDGAVIEDMLERYEGTPRRLAAGWTNRLGTNSSGRERRYVRRKVGGAMVSRDSRCASMSARPARLAASCLRDKIRLIGAVPRIGIEEFPDASNDSAGGVGKSIRR